MEIYYQSVTGEETLKLRQQVLRPGQKAEDCRFPEDRYPETLHMGAFRGPVLTGIASVLPDPSHERDWRLRGMAVLPEYRGHGIGQKLLEHCMTHAFSRGAALVWCNARSPAVEFYKRSGFEVKGEEFHLEGIGPHFRMVKIFTGKVSEG